MSRLPVCMGGRGITAGLATLSFVPLIPCFFKQSTMSTNNIYIGTLNDHSQDHSKHVTVNVPAGTNPADLIRAFMSDCAEDVTPDFSSSVSPESNSGNTRGPRTQYLFSDARGNEDTQRAATEADRVRKYITDHKMGQYQLDSKTSSKLNLMVACFWYRWYELDMVDEEPQGAAIYRFFTNQCGLECSVMPKAFATVICKIINSGKKDPEIYDNLYSYFPELNKNNRN